MAPRPEELRFGNRPRPHSQDAYAVTDTKFNDINIGLDAFVREMKAQGVWNQVALQSLSEFGRTMTSNGLGTGKCLSLPCIICGTIPARWFPTPIDLTPCFSPRI